VRAIKWKGCFFFALYIGCGTKSGGETVWIVQGNDLRWGGMLLTETLNTIFSFGGNFCKSRILRSDMRPACDGRGRIHHSLAKMRE